MNSSSLQPLGNGIRGNESPKTEAFENPAHDYPITPQLQSNSRNETTYTLSTR